MQSIMRNLEGRKQTLSRVDVSPTFIDYNYSRLAVGCVRQIRHHVRHDYLVYSFVFNSCRHVARALGLLYED